MEKSPPAPLPVLAWLASEPFRIFFLSGALWSVIGVSLWPLFYQGFLGFYPSLVHSRLMIEAFGGAFVTGFLGTAGPRMAGAPRLTAAELAWLFSLHLASSFCHLCLQPVAGDLLFGVQLISLLMSLIIRLVRFRQEAPPPQLILALSGPLCALGGIILFLLPSTAADPGRHRLASLLLSQGLLLPPVLGIGAFLFPRILGGEFGGPASPREAARSRRRACAAVVLLLAGFLLQAFAVPPAGHLLTALTAAGYLLREIPWRGPAVPPARGTLAGALPWALLTGMAGLVLAGFFPAARISAEHLLYIGGFGLLILITASRVLFGHSGNLPEFDRRSWVPRLLVFLALLTAATRATTGFFPQLTVSHHLYAAVLWALLILLWLVWHRARFFSRDAE